MQVARWALTPFVLRRNRQKEGVVGGLSQSQRRLGEKLVANSQFSQREVEADDYSYDLLRKRGISPAGLPSFETGKTGSGWKKLDVDDHPASARTACARSYNTDGIRK